jgi:uncharacterized protein (TIGR00369 family)
MVIAIIEEAIMSETLAIGRAILEAQPFSRLLGTQMTRYENGEVELVLPMSEQLQQQHGFAHGGVVGYLADNSMTFAAGLAMGGGVLTAETKLNLTRPAIGDTLIARANTVSFGRTQGVARCEIYAVKDGEEKLCAVGQGTVLRAQIPSGS